MYHYRDSVGLECDTVIHHRNGKYGLAEIKLGGEKLINEGAANLMKLREKIDTKKNDCSLNSLDHYAVCCIMHYY